MRQLSKRLKAVSGLVAAGGCIADIGTDHGYLPVYLVENGTCSSAIAMDVNPGPLERARQHILENGLTHRVEVRLSDGLAALKQGEADSVVLTGMGGSLIVRILETGQRQLSSVKELIIGAQSDLFKVRAFLWGHGMYIDREDLVYEDGKYYPLLHAAWEKPGYWQDAGYIGLQKELKKKLPQGLYDQMRGQYGEYLLYKRHPVFYRMLERDAKVKRRILDDLESSRQEGKSRKTDALEGSRQEEKRASRCKEVDRQLEGIQVYLDFYVRGYT